MKYGLAFIVGWVICGCVVFSTIIAPMQAQIELLKDQVRNVNICQPGVTRFYKDGTMDTCMAAEWREK